MRESPRVCWPTLLALLCAAGVIIALWNSGLIYPLKILVVFFHELSHGLAAVITGGHIERIEIVAQQGGHCVTRGGNRFVILSAGYLGSMLWGAALLVLATRTAAMRPLSVLLGVVLIGVSVLWVRPLASFGFVFCIVSGIAWMAVGLRLPEGINRRGLQLAALVSCLYPIPDIVSDVLARPGLHSDAVMLAEHTGVPSMIWGVSWIAAAAVGIAALWLASGSPSSPVRHAPAKG